jgi:copper transport protein
VTTLQVKRRRRWTLRLCAATTIALLTLLALAGAADAHATLLTTTPAPGAVLTASPATIELRFSEPVEFPQQAIRLFDANRKEVALSALRHGATNDIVTATLPALADGGYVVAWRVVSADGHPVSAAFTFGVGQPSGDTDIASALAQLAPQGASRASGVLYGIARALAYAAIAVLIGAAFVAALVWPAAFDDARGRRLLLGSGIVAIFTTALVYGFQGLNTRGGRLHDLASWDTWHDVASTHVGRWLLARMLALAVATMVIGLVFRTHGAGRKRATWALLAACEAVAACVAVTGHASTGRYTALGMVADLVHVGAFSLWAGGLVIVLVAVLPAADAATAWSVTSRFSQIAFASVVTLVATGTFMAWRQGVALRHPIATDYGTLLVIKIAVVASMVAAGAMSRQVLRSHAPRADVGTRLWRAQIRRTITAEAVLGLAVFSVSAMLVNAAPPLSAGTGPVEIRRTVAGLTVDAVIDPARVGPTDLHVYISGATTLQPNIEELTVELSQPVLGNAPIEVKMLRAGPAHFQSSAMAFPFAGTWTITVGVRTDEFTRYTTDASIYVS